LVEHSLGKGEVTGSIPVISSRFFAQVAEWLMAADCKSAPQRGTEVRILPCAPGFGSKRVDRAGQARGILRVDMMRVAGAKRKILALAILAVLATLAWYTMDAGRIRLLVMVLLGGFALRIVLTRGSPGNEEEAEEQR
jgi:hypothetical protein